MIETRGLTVSVSGRVLVRALDVRVLPGSPLLVRGPNGSGKSCLLRSIVHGDFLAAGTVDAGPQPLGYLAQTVDLPWSLTLAQAIEVATSGSEPSESLVEDLLAILDMGSLRASNLWSLSFGQARQAQFLLASLNSGGGLLLDEPLNGLKSNVSERMVEAIEYLSSNRAVIVVDHDNNHLIPIIPRHLNLEADDRWSIGVADEPGTASDYSCSVGRARGGPLSETLISLDRGRVSVGGRAVLDDVSLEVQAGVIVAIVGANGSGKTTLLDCLAGVRSLDDGSIDLRNAAASRRRCRTPLSYAPQPDGLFDNLDAAETWKLRSMCYEWTPDRFEGLVKSFRAHRLLNASTGQMSGGERKRIDVLLCLAVTAQIYLLDEPTAGLDSDTKRTLAKELVGLTERGAAVVLSEHDLEFVAAMADVAYGLKDGRLTALANASTGATRDFINDRN